MGVDADADYVMLLDFYAREYHWTINEIDEADPVLLALLGKAIEFRRLREKHKP